MAIVGRATVIVQALADTFREDLRRQFAGSERDADAAGERVGGRFGQRFSKAAQTGVDGVSFDSASGNAERAGEDGGKRFIDRFRARLKELEQLKLDGLSGNAGQAGDTSGTSFANRFRSRIDGIGAGLGGLFNGVRRDAESAGDDSGRGFFDNLLRRGETGAADFERQVSGAGNNVARDLSAIKIDLPNIGGAFPGQLLAIIPLVGVLGGALAALVGGLTALASAATFAAGSLAALATGIVGAGLGAVTAFLAFSGISKALGALNKQQAAAASGAVANGRAQTAAADAVRSAQQRVVDAEYNLQQVRKNAAESAVRDEHSVEQAERSLIAAQQAAKDAQDNLTQSRIDAKSHLEDLQLQLRGSVLGEESASIRLAKAQQAYQQTLTNPNATGLQREEARLALQEAELALDEAKKRNIDLTKSTADANKKGIEGADNVVRAKKNVATANQGVKDAEYNLAQARQQQRDDAIKAQHDIAHAVLEVANAQLAVTRALEAQKQAATGGAAAANNVAKAFANLTPQAAAFARYLFSLKPLLEQLKTAAGSQLFGPLLTDVQSLVKNLFPALLKAITFTSTGLSHFFGEITKGLTGTDFTTNLTEVAKALSKVHDETGTSDFGLFGRIVGNILRGIVGLARAAEPVFRRFLGFVSRITGSFADKFKGGDNVKHMTDLISSMGDEAAKIGSIFGATFGIIGNIFRAALPSGKDLNTSLLTTLQTFQKWTGSGPGQKRMHDFFKNIIPPVQAVGRFVVSLAKAFLKLGEDGAGKKGGGGIVKVFNDISKNLPNIGRAIEVFTNKVAPAMVHIIAQLIDIFRKFSESPAFTILVGTIGLLATAIKGFVNVLQFGPIGKFTGALLGLVAAYIALRKIGKITGVEALVQSVRQGAAPQATTRARSAGGLGAAIQGARGRRVVDPEDRVKTTRTEIIRDADGKKIGKRRITEPLILPDGSHAGDRSAANRFGAALTPTGRQSLRADQEGAPTTRRGRAAAAFGRGADRLQGRGGTAAAGALVVGISLAEAVKQGKIKGLGDAAKQAGKLFTDNFQSAILIAGPAIFGSLGRGAKAAAAPIGRALGSAATGAGGLVKSLATVGGEYLKLGGKAAGAAIKTGLLATAQRIAGVASKIFAVGIRLVGLAFDFALGPVGLVIIGITLLVAGIILAYKHSKTFRDIVDAVGRALKAAAEYILGVVIGAFKFLRDHVQYLLLALGPLGAAVFVVIEVFKHFDEIEKIVSKVVGAVVDFFTKLPGRILGALASIGSVVGGFLGRAFSTFASITDKALIAVVSFFTALPERIVRGLASLAGTVGGALRTAFSALGGFASNAVGDIVGYFTGLPGRLTRGLSTIASALAGAGKAIGQPILNGIKTVLDGALTIVKAPINLLLKGLREVLHTMGRIGFTIDTHTPLGKIGFKIPDFSDHVPADLALGGTVLPRPGGTVVRLGEAGRAESVVDTGLLNKRLRDDLTRGSDVVAELRKVRATLERISTLSGLTIQNLNATAAPNEPAAASVPRALRSLAFELGS